VCGGAENGKAPHDGEALDSCAAYAARYCLKAQYEIRAMSFSAAYATVPSAFRVSHDSLVGRT